LDRIYTYIERFVLIPPWTFVLVFLRVHVVPPHYWLKKNGERGSAEASIKHWRPWVHCHFNFAPKIVKDIV